MSETRTIRLTAAQWRAVEGSLEDRRLVNEERASLWNGQKRSDLLKTSRTALIALDKIRAAKEAK